MPLFGKIVVIKRNGADGISFPLTASSCLFGRRTECDIRIQLPQVSKEHCKIEINENKEAILTNLSTVNPTQLNGGCFQQPVPLKHGDVLTVIDRSFRFEYPLQSTPRKRRSRSPKDETLQVLHVQQVAEVELLHKQTPGSKGLRASDKTECEEKKGNENKQNTEENISKTLPVKLQTPKSSHRIHPSSKIQNEISPFGKLYEKLKEEIKVRRLLHKGNESEPAAKEDGTSVPLKASTQISSSICAYDLGNLSKEKGIDTSGNKEAGKTEIKQDVICLELDQNLTAGSATKKSFTRSPRTPKEVSRHTERSHWQHNSGLSTAGKSEGTEVTTKPRKESDGNAASSLKQCSIERSVTALDKPAQTTSWVSVSEVSIDVLSTPTRRRKSLRSLLSLTKEPGGMNPVHIDTPTTQRCVSMKREPLSDIAAEAPREDSVCRDDGVKQLPLAENKCLKQRRNSKQQTPGKPVKEVLEEICDQAALNFLKSKEGHSETPPSDSRSPRRNNRQSKELSHKSVCSEALALEEVTSELTSPASQKSSSGRKKGRPRSSGLLPDKAPEANAVQEHYRGTEEELATKGCAQKQALEDVNVPTPRRLSLKRRASGSATGLQDSEAVSEMNVSSLLAEEASGKTKGMSEKRKSEDLFLQPSGKRKRVSFGGHLSPELFDKSLPPNSPLKRGAIPSRLSTPFGNSPRAVLKKAQGLKLFDVQKEKMSPKNLLSQKSPTASSPASGKATPRVPLGSPAPCAKGRFSVSHITTPSPIAEEKEAVAEDLSTEETSGARINTPKPPVNQDNKTISAATPDKLTRSTQLALKVTPMKRRSGAVAVINAKRRSGASSANLLVAKSWAEVVKSGVARPQSKTVKKSVRRGRPPKRAQSQKTPERKVKGHFSTGHAKSPTTIVVGRAYSTTVRTAGQVPKVVKNALLKLNMNMDESFTGMSEMFQTPENKSGKALPLVTAQQTDLTPTCTTVEVSELHTPEETGEMMVSPLNSPDASEEKHDSPRICHFLREQESLESTFDATSTTPGKRETLLEESISVDSLLIPEKQASWLKSGSKKRTPKQKMEPAEVSSGIKQLLRTPKQRSESVEALLGIKELMKTPKQKSECVEPLSAIKRLLRTPKQKSEPVEALSGIKQLMRTPKQKPEPVEVLSGIKRLMRTPKQKPEPVEVLSGVKRLMRTPKQKPEPVEVLSGVKRLMRTPKQKPEPVEVLSGIKQLVKTPKQKPEPVEVLSGVKRLMRTPKQKPEPAEVLSGIKQLMRTPKQKPEPVEVLSGIKQLMRTPKQKPEPVEVLSGIKQLMRTPKQKPEPVEVLSGIKQLMKTPEQELEPVTDEIAFAGLLKTPVQEKEAAKHVASVTSVKKTPKLKYEPVEDMVGVRRIFRTPKEKVEPIEDMFGISRLVKTPREKYQPVDDFVGLQRLMAEPRQKCSDFEEDYVGVTEMFDIPEEIKVASVNVMDSKQAETAVPCANSSRKPEKGNVSQGEDSQEKESSSEDHSTQKSRRGRPRKAVLPASAKQCEKESNLKELQSLGRKSTQEEMEEISTSVAKNERRGRRANYGVEEIVSKHLDQEKAETVSFVEPCGATQRPGRGRRKEPKELKHPSENPESCGKDSSVLQEEPTNTKQILQECGIRDVLKPESDPTPKTRSVSSSIPDEQCQLQTGLKPPENKTNAGGAEESEEKLLSPRRRSRGGKEVENTEVLLSPKRGRRARNDQLKQAPSEDLHGTRRLRRHPSANRTQRDEQTSAKDAEAATAEESETKTNLEITEKRVKSLRSARKCSTEVRADACGVAPENTPNIRETEEASTETDPETHSHVKKEIKVSQGDETVNAQENTTETSQRLKAESPSGETNKMPVTTLSLEATRSRNRRGKKDSLEKKTDEFTKDINTLELVTPKFKSETEMDESSLTDSLGSVCVRNMSQVTKDQKSPAPTSPAHSGQRQTRNRQRTLKPKQTEIQQEDQAQNNGLTCRRGRGKTVHFELKDSSKTAEGKKGLPEDDKVTRKNEQCATSESAPVQVRRSRRRQVDSVPQIACSTSVEQQTLIADHSKDEASVKEQDSALEATPSSTEETPPRRGRRRGVAAASQTSRSLSVRRRRGLLEGDDKKMTVMEDQNPALGNKTLQAEANASARDKREKIDLAAEAKSSPSLQRKRGLSETDDKEEGTNEERNPPLDTVSCAKERPLGRGRRKVTALPSHTSNYISLRGKRGVAGNNGREEGPKGEQSVSLETSDSSVKENPRRKGRREMAALLEAPNSTSGQDKQGLSKESGRKTNYREAKRLILENSPSHEKNELSKAKSRTTVTSMAPNSTSLQGSAEDGKNETPGKQESMLLEAAPSAKESSPRVGRRKTVSSKYEEASSTCLREKSGLSRAKSQKRILKEGEDTSSENNSSQGKTRQLRNKRTKVEFRSEAATSTSVCKNGAVPENGNTLDAQNVCSMVTGSDKSHQAARGKELNPVQQAAPAARKRKCLLPADDVAPKRVKSEDDENRLPQRARRNPTKEEVGEKAVRATRAAGGTDRKTRSSSRTSARTRK
ncbi:proliferation marker protein Ki-67 isoform X2 [Colius striatus]|uniref:proliferation marker protein Ki-67 isoform X2 n=1 Tax=Colius striatus TaxID=57412 RepID=UPI002B1DB150|nr:proliferation marker protein Ki-67 isoform X2 [Colius striatus]